MREALSARVRYREARRRGGSSGGRRGSWARPRGCAFSSYARSTLITPLARSTSSHRRAMSSPRRRPADNAVAHTGRSRAGRAASSCSASCGDAIRSRRPRTAGSRRCAHGLTATSPSSTARRKSTRSGTSAFRIVDGSRPLASRSSAIRWTSRCWTSPRRVRPIRGTSDVQRDSRATVPFGEVVRRQARKHERIPANKPILAGQSRVPPTRIELVHAV